MSSPERNSVPLAARWLPLRQRVAATVYLTLLLALLFGVGAVWMAQMTRSQTDELVRLADASNAVRGFRTNVDRMQFAAYRFVAANHGSAVAQVSRLYSATRDSLTDCLVTRCVDASAEGRIEALLEGLDRFYKAFTDAVAQRSVLNSIIDQRFTPNLVFVRQELPTLVQPESPGAQADSARALDALNLRAIQRHLLAVEEATDALLYSANLQPYSSLAIDFECERGHLARLSPSVPEASVAAIRTALEQMERVWGALLQRARGYLFLVNVVMAADAHEMQVIAGQLEQQIETALVDAHRGTDSKLFGFASALILLLLFGSLAVFALGRAMATSVTHQLRALTQTFNDLAAGSRAQIRIQSPHNDEIGELAMAAARFRDANAEIHDLLARYQALNEALESKVAERTSALEESNRQLERLAHTDRLTGVLNRRALEQLLEDEVKRSQRYSRPLSLMYLDLDHFKEINDRHGHEVGDVVLVRLARELGAMLRAHDRLGRWGGEEFLILCSETTGEDARSLAERIRVQVEQLQLESVGQVTLSIGIASLAPTQTVERLLAEADQAMYRAKSLGRNRCVLA
ncbi:hypothetical protein CKO42_22595 [Lamprobacter modestohalophilus]|uniref:diguanylate cyclase n=1 Tax=Lamprobacter modestohalophilus TaxID=1064514 RepID=A0A9X0WD02_9GAMM|nr:diguanylate cyclase [Lamprobacter modestohalophilus]MBK1621157.1 hypothetical protein [Lamprobacter modestohalophilus]